MAVSATKEGRSTFRPDERARPGLTARPAACIGRSALGLGTAAESTTGASGRVSMLCWPLPISRPSLSPSVERT